MITMNEKISQEKKKDLTRINKDICKKRKKEEDVKVKENGTISVTSLEEGKIQKEKKK